MTLERKIDPAAFGVIYEEYAGLLINFAIRKGVKDAEDLVATAFLNAWAKIDSYNPIAPFSRYMFRIAHNLVANHYREKARSNGPIASISELSIHATDPWGNPETYCQTRETGRELRDALGKLTPRQRVAIIAHHIDDLTLDETAQLIGTSRGGAKSLIHRGLTRLKILLQNPAQFSVHLDTGVETLPNF